MKKIIYITLFAVVSSLSFSACTEEVVAPTVLNDNGGGEVSAPPLKKGNP